MVLAAGLAPPAATVIVLAAAEAGVTKEKLPAMNASASMIANGKAIIRLFVRFFIIFIIFVNH